MSGTTKEIKLNKVVNKLSKKDSYVARLAQRYSLGYDEVLDEVIGRGFLNVSKPMLKMILEHTFDTMIANTLKDGNSRRLGDYFVLQMEVEGRFESPDDQFDANRHKLALKLRPLKAMKRKPGRDDISVYNRNAGPQVVIDRMHSASTPDKDTLVFGDDIVLEGENLFFIDNVDYPLDSIDFGYYTQHQGTPFHTGSSGSLPGTVSADGRRMVISWEKTIGAVLELNRDRPSADPAKDPPQYVMVALRSRGGVPTAKMQHHRARAFFDTWLAKYPNSSFANRPWGDL